jgi:carboxyl-terminal processing protease
MEKKKRNLLPIIIALVIGAVALIVMAGFGSYFFVRSVVSSQVATPPLELDSPEADSPELEETSNANLEELFSPFWLTRDLLHDNFIHQPVDDRVLAEGALRGLEQYLETFEISLPEAVLPEDSPDLVKVARAAGTPITRMDTFLPFWQAWASLDSLDLPDEATEITLMRSALAGMVASLEDRHTNYFDPDLAQQYNIDLSGEYEGIGAWMDTRTEYLTVVSPMKGTPAEAAGLKPGDQVIAIDGDDMTGVDPGVAIKRVLGEAGTKVVLTLLREGLDEPFDVEIIRSKITIPYIESEILEGNIAYISLATFYDDGDVDFENTLKDLLSNDPDGLIVDLRSNGGGYVHVVIGIVSDFINKGNVLIEEFGDGSTKDYPVLPGQGIALDIPLVILINQGSASASEILAGAVRDYQRGTLIGMTSFGKGSVQLPIDLPDNQGMVSITHALWLTPNGDTIQGTGIEPDIIVDYTEEDAEAGIDPQLDRAIEFLLIGE